MTCIHVSSLFGVCEIRIVEGQREFTNCPGDVSNFDMKLIGKYGNFLNAVSQKGTNFGTIEFHLCVFHTSLSYYPSTSWSQSNMSMLK